MPLAAYRDGPSFAYPGWRLTVPGGPAGGHYKGFTHTQSAGTDIVPGDQYEQDTASASVRNPRGVYRSSAEVPPRPNASGAAHTYRGFQTARHAGTSVAPGSFPADYFDTQEDLWLPPSGAHGKTLGSLGFLQPQFIPVYGATNRVAQPSGTMLPVPPAQAVAVHTVQPISPTPAPIVATNEVLPLNDGSGNYINISTGAIVPASSVLQNPATGQITTSASSFATGALTWLEQSTLISGIPNWGLIAAGLGAAFLMMRGHR
jgi:hypothetical protein